MAKMNQGAMIVFVCEHGAAKSIIAAAYFNRLARENNLSLTAIARGTNPADKLSPQTVEGLFEDGLTTTESVPQKLAETDIQSAHRVVTFCELPIEYHQEAIVERWDNIPPVSENYEMARDAIIEHICQMLNH